MKDKKIINKSYGVSDILDYNDNIIHTVNVLGSPTSNCQLQAIKDDFNIAWRLSDENLVSIFKNIKNRRLLLFTVNDKRAIKRLNSFFNGKYKTKLIEVVETKKFKTYLIRFNS